MAVGIRAVQAGVVLADGSAVHPAPITVDDGVLLSLSFTGVTASYRWALPTRPPGSGAVISSASSAAPTVLPDIDNGAYSATLTDSSENVYVLDIVTPTIPAAPGADGVSSVVTTIASLRVAGAASGSASTIDVRCHSLLGDGGGGPFDYDASDTTTADNNGIVIVCGTRRYKRRFYGDINVRWFGARGDGTTNDQPAIQAAINWVGQQTSVQLQSTYVNYTVWIPKGVYALGLIQAGFKVALELYPATSLIFEEGAALKPHASVISPIGLIRCANWQQRISGGTFIGGPMVAHCIVLMGLTTNGDYFFGPTAGIDNVLRIDHCKFVDPIGPAIWHDPSPVSHPAFYRTIQQHLEVSHCEFHCSSAYWGMHDSSDWHANFFQWDMSNLGFYETKGKENAAVFTANASTNLLTSAGNTLANFDVIFVSNAGGALPGGLTAGVPYFVRDKAGDDFAVTPNMASNVPGAAVDITTPGTGVQTFTQKRAYQISDDGLPLALINCWGNTTFSGHNLIENLNNGSDKPPQPDRRVMFIGVGSTYVRGVTQYDGGSATWRNRSIGNTYQGPIGEGPASLSVNILAGGLFHLTHSFMSLVGLNFVEAYDVFPNAIRVDNTNVLQTDQSVGIYVNADTIALFGLLQKGLVDQVIQIDEPRFDRLRIRYATEATGALANAGAAGVTDLTGRLRASYHHRNHEEIEAVALGSDNLFPPQPPAGLASAGPNVRIVSTNAAFSGTDTTLGYTLDRAAASAAEGMVGFETPNWANITPGFYTMSWYYSAEFDAIGSCQVTIEGQTPHFIGKDIINAPGQFQRQWFTIWHDSSGGPSATFTANAGTDTITSAAHGLNNDEIVFVSNAGGALPAGLTAGTSYYVVNGAANTFQVSISPGGAVFDFTTNGTGTQTWTRARAVRFRQIIGGVPNGKGWIPGLWMINRGSAPAPYVWPKGTAAAVTPAALPADPTIANSHLGQQVRSTYWLAALPTAGAYYAGDTIMILRPASGAVWGYKCTTSGLVGGAAVFKAMGTLA